ncbi:MAG: ABC transporter substrate-binding protein, partial [Methanophagales archaeon]|nr:ABC transporter substrate-binding protein [Methanophagales archaeon]
KVSMLDVGQTKLIILAKERELSLIDHRGKTVTVSMPVKTIISLYDVITKGIRALQKDDKLVAIEDDVKSRPQLWGEISELPSVGRGSSPDHEVIFELNPDLVVGSSIEAMNELEAGGITAVCLRYYTPQNQTEDFRKLAYLLDARDKAEEFIAWRESWLNEIKEKVEEISEDEKPRVYYEAWADYKTATKACVRGQMIELAGGINIAHDLSDILNPSVDPEWVIEQNPNVIIRNMPHPPLGNGYEIDDPKDLIELRKAIMNRPGFEHIDAVKTGRVYIMSYDISIRNYFLGVPFMAKTFHPKLFADMDPNAMHQEWLDNWQRIDFNVYEHGTFYYPPPSSE